MTPTLVYPHPKGAKSTVNPAWIHDTSGIGGNKALDFMAPGGTLVLAPEHGRIVRFSGHNPAEGLFPKTLPKNQRSVIGWSLYLETVHGFYFLTHLAKRYCSVGQIVVPGMVIGRVLHWPDDEGRSHTHAGFTSHKGTSAAIAHVRAVAKAPRVKPIQV